MPAEKKKEKTMTIKEIRQIVDYSERDFLPKVTREVEEMQKKKLDVEIQYSISDNIFSAMIIGRAEAKKNESTKTL